MGGLQSVSKRRKSSSSYPHTQLLPTDENTSSQRTQSSSNGEYTALLVQDGNEDDDTAHDRGDSLDVLAALGHWDASPPLSDFSNVSTETLQFESSDEASSGLQLPRGCTDASCNSKCEQCQAVMNPGLPLSDCAALGVQDEDLLLGESSLPVAAAAVARPPMDTRLTLPPLLPFMEEPDELPFDSVVISDRASSTPMVPGDVSFGRTRLGLNPASCGRSSGMNSPASTGSANSALSPTAPLLSRMQSEGDRVISIHSNSWTY